MYFVCGDAWQGWIRDPEAALSPEADFLRLLLWTYPEAAGIEVGLGVLVGRAATLLHPSLHSLSLLTLYPHLAPPQGGVGPGRMSPYECARLDGADPYFLRLLLNACPAAGPEDRRRLNYDARKYVLSPTPHPRMLTSLSLLD